MAAIKEAILPLTGQEASLISSSKEKTDGGKDFSSVFNDVELQSANDTERTPADLKQRNQKSDEDAVNASNPVEIRADEIRTQQDNEQASAHFQAEQAHEYNEQTQQRQEQEIDASLSEEEKLESTTQQQIEANEQDEKFQAAVIAANDFLAKLQAAAQIDTRLNVTNAADEMTLNDDVSPVDDEINIQNDSELEAAMLESEQADDTATSFLVTKQTLTDAQIQTAELSASDAKHGTQTTETSTILAGAAGTLKVLSPKEQQQVLLQLEHTLNKAELSADEKGELKQLVAQLRVMLNGPETKATEGAQTQTVSVTSPASKSAPDEDAVKRAQQIISDHAEQKTAAASNPVPGTVSRAGGQLNEVGNNVIAAMLSQSVNKDTSAEDKVSLSPGAKVLQAGIATIKQGADANAPAKEGVLVAGDDLSLEVDDTAVEMQGVEDADPRAVRQARLLQLVNQAITQLTGSDSARSSVSEAPETPLSTPLHPVSGSLHAQTRGVDGQGQKVHLDAATMQAINLARSDAVKVLQERVNMMLNLNNKEADIRLDPPELGSMQIRVRSDAEQAHINFVVQNQQAKEMLEQSMPRLREMLAQQGINLGESSIEQGSQGQQGGEEQLAGGSGHAEQNQNEQSQGAAQPQLRTESDGQGIDFYA